MTLTFESNPTGLFSFCNGPSVPEVGLPLEARSFDVLSSFGTKTTRTGKRFVCQSL